MKKILMILIVGMFLVSFAGVAYAEEASSDVSSITAFFNNLKHSFSIGQFSVVGDSRSCGLAGGNPNYEWSVASGKALSGSGGVLTGTAVPIPANSLIDIFTNGWTPFLEVKDFSQYNTCGVGPCNIQVYVCPSAEPTSCPSGQTLTTVNCPIWAGRTNSAGVPITAYQCPTETGIPYYTSSYKYCTQASTMTCYYNLPGSTDCGSRTYDKSVFPNACESYTYQTQALYSSYSTCKANICVPNSCAANTCSGQTCGDGCGGIQSGTKDCTTTPPVTPPVTPPAGEPIVVSNIKLPPSSNILIATPLAFEVTLTNTGTNTETVSVEAGFYTQSYAKDVAQLFSFIPLFSTVNPVANCVPTEDFVKTKSVTLAPGESETVTVNQAPIYAYVTQPVGTYVLKDVNLVSFLGVYRMCCQKLAEGGCVAGTGGYIDSSYDTTFHLTTTFWPNYDITCGGKIYGKVNWKGELIISSPPTGCIQYEIYNESGTLTNITTYGGSLVNTKKFSLTADEITSGTNTELLASACLASDECLPRNNYSVSCVSINKLKEQGIVGATQGDSILEDGKQIVTNGIIGGSLGGAAGLITCALIVGAAGTATAVTAGAAAPVLVPAITGCAGVALAGAYIGSGLAVGGTLLWQQNPSDNLVTALKAKDANSVGICTAQASGSFDKIISSLAFFRITGDAQTDGLIIGGTILLVLVILLFRK